MKKLVLFSTIILLSACVNKLTQTEPTLTATFRNSNSGSVAYTKEAKTCYKKGIFVTENDFSIPSIAKKGGIKEVISVERSGNVSGLGYRLDEDYCIIVRGN